MESSESSFASSETETAFGVLFSEMRSRLQSDTPFLTTHTMTPIPRPESGKASHRTHAAKDVPQNFVAMEQLVVRLRREVANMKNQVTRAKNSNAELQKELNTATLKITHLTGKSAELLEIFHFVSMRP